MNDRKTQADIENDLREVIAQIFPHQKVDLTSSTPSSTAGSR